MSRSWSKKGIPLKGWIAMIMLAVAGIFWWQWRLGQAVPFKDIRSLEMNAYLERPSTLRGSSFTLRGTVHQTLASSTEAGRLILVMTLAPRDSTEAPEPLPLHVPPDLIARMQTGRQFVFKVMVGDAGVLVVQDAAEI
jgi:hypothetical protein